MTYIFPEARWNIDQVIEKLDYIQYQMPRQENQALTENDDVFPDGK
ncbi:hypothetical protein [Rickettsiella massiliensis]|nr:hypothetical protein [Rickettsiella massiliensis]